MEELERRYVIKLLEAHGGNIARAARAAGLPRGTLFRIIHKLGVTRLRRARRGSDAAGSGQGSQGS
jgi:DNA-binding NtrC family response regulator